MLTETLRIFLSNESIYCLFDGVVTVWHKVSQQIAFTFSFATGELSTVKHLQLANIQIYHIEDLADVLNDLHSEFKGAFCFDPFPFIIVFQKIYLFVIQRQNPHYFMRTFRVNLIMKQECQRHRNLCCDTQQVCQDLLSIQIPRTIDLSLVQVIYIYIMIQILSQIQ